MTPLRTSHTNPDRSAAAHEVIDLLAELAAIDSANPSLSPTGPGEDAIATHVTEWAHAQGLATTWLEATPGRPSVVVRGGHATGGRTLVLCGHLDTVGHPDRSTPPQPRSDGDRMVGRGTYDMKAGLAAQLIACRDAAAAGLDGEVVVAAVADEEHASLGAHELLDHLTTADIRPDGAIVAEPTELAVATAHRGFVWMRIDVTGVAAHGSRPHLGVDAIFKIGPILVALAELDATLATHAHPLLGPANLHGSLISGGVEESSIPGHASLTIERRTLPGETAADVEAEVAAVLDRCRAADPALEVTATTTLVRSPLQTAADAGITRALRNAVALHDDDGSQRARPEVTGMSYWADSAILADAGIPTVLYGPAGDGAHADHEWVSLASTVTCTQVLTATAHEFCT